MDKILRSTSVTGSRKLTDKDRHKNPRRGNDPSEVAENTSAERVPPRQEEGSNPSEEEISSADVLDKVSSKSEGSSLNYAATVVEHDKQRINELTEKCKEYENGLEELVWEKEQLEKSLNDFKEQTFKQAYEKGLEAAREKVIKERGEAEETVAGLITTLKKSVSSELEQLEPLAIEIALAALCRLIGDHYKDTDFVKAAVRNVLKNVQAQSNVVIRINPDQYDIIFQAKDEFSSLLETQELKIVADSRVGIGGCLLETDQGHWDGRLETQLHRLVDAINQAEQQRD